MAYDVSRDLLKIYAIFHPREKGAAAFVARKKIPRAPTLPIGPPILADLPV
jgi:hypothetical protein